MAVATQAAAPVATLAKKTPKQLPAPNSDFYQLADVLTAEEMAHLKMLSSTRLRSATSQRSASSRRSLQPMVMPVIPIRYWSRR